MINNDKEKSSSSANDTGALHVNRVKYQDTLVENFLSSAKKREKIKKEDLYDLIFKNTHIYSHISNVTINGHFIFTDSNKTLCVLISRGYVHLT